MAAVIRVMNTDSFIPQLLLHIAQEFNPHKSMATLASLL